MGGMWAKEILPYLLVEDYEEKRGDWRRIGGFHTTRVEVACCLRLRKKDGDT